MRLILKKIEIKCVTSKLVEKKWNKKEKSKCKRRQEKNKTRNKKRQIESAKYVGRI